jgi:predicted DsbA family dithiol-disulfide isomerase
MKIEIWSDIMCPFCYIGKRKLEAALAKFEHKDAIEIIWKSYQLDPNMQYEPGKNIYSYLAERKGFSIAQSEQMHQQVVVAAKNVGLTYNFDIAVINNSFDAHRLIQFAKSKNLGNQMEERLFKAYFTEGKNMGDHATLAALGHDIGLNKDEIKSILASSQFSQEVKNDLIEANQLEVRGVPFFVLDRKFAISGAQDESVFLQTIEKAFANWETKKSDHTHSHQDGATCSPDGACL